MANASSEARWRQELTNAGCPDVLRDEIINDGYNTAGLMNFAFRSEEALDRYVETKLTGAGAAAQALALTQLTWATSPAAAAMRQAWWSAHALAEQRPAADQVGAPAAAPATSWMDSAPVRLTFEQQRMMKESFRANYPGELLDASTTPGQRYWAVVHSQVRTPGKYKWVPWNQIVSEKREGELLEAKALKTPRSELGMLGAMLFDEIPHIPEADIRASPWWISQLQTVRRNALALAGGAHLANLKKFDARFLSLYTKQYDEASGLRAPNLAEAMAADRDIFEKTFELVNERDWSLDDALHEISEVRSEMSVQLQPRPRPHKGKGKPQESGKGFSRKGDAHKGDRKGDKGQRKGGKKGDGRKGDRERSRDVSGWDRSWAMSIDGRQICMRYHLSSCQQASCRYLHRCPVPDANGRPCGQNHRAAECPLRGAPRG